MKYFFGVIFLLVSVNFTFASITQIEQKSAPDRSDLVYFVVSFDKDDVVENKANGTETYYFWTRFGYPLVTVNHLAKCKMADLNEIKYRTQPLANSTTETYLMAIIECPSSASELDLSQYSFKLIRIYGASGTKNVESGTFSPQDLINFKDGKYSLEELNPQASKGIESFHYDLSQNSLEISFKDADLLKTELDGNLKTVAVLTKKGGTNSICDVCRPFYLGENYIGHKTSFQIENDAQYLLAITQMPQDIELSQVSRYSYVYAILINPIYSVSLTFQDLTDFQNGTQASAQTEAVSQQSTHSDSPDLNAVLLDSTEKSNPEPTNNSYLHTMNLGILINPKAINSLAILSYTRVDQNQNPLAVLNLGFVDPSQTFESESILAAGGGLWLWEHWEISAYRALLTEQQAWNIERTGWYGHSENQAGKIGVISSFMPNLWKTGVYASWDIWDNENPPNWSVSMQFKTLPGSQKVPCVIAERNLDTLIDRGFCDNTVTLSAMAFNFNLWYSFTANYLQPVTLKNDTESIPMAGDEWVKVHSFGGSYSHNFTNDSNQTVFGFTLQACAYLAKQFELSSVSADLRIYQFGIGARWEYPSKTLWLNTSMLVF